MYALSSSNRPCLENPLDTQNIYDRVIKWENRYRIIAIKEYMFSRVLPRHAWLGSSSTLLARFSLDMPGRVLPQYAWQVSPSNLRYMWLRFTIWLRFTNSGNLIGFSQVFRKSPPSVTSKPEINLSYTSPREIKPLASQKITC